MQDLPKIEFRTGNNTFGHRKIELKKKAGSGGQEGRVNDMNKDFYDLYESNSQSSAKKEPSESESLGRSQKFPLYRANSSLGVSELLRECRNSNGESPEGEMVFEE